MHKHPGNGGLLSGNPNLEQLEVALGYEFKNKELLKLAVTHESYANEQDPEIGNNERLEFLGDSVLGVVVCHYLYQKHTTANEGILAKIKAFVASTSYLAEKARDIRLGDFLMLGKGENLSMGRNRPNVLADTFEAVVGAMFLDGGLEPAERFVLGLLRDAMDRMEGSRRDFKSILQEYTQHFFKTLPTYNTLEESGPPHDRTFVMEVCLGQDKVGRGAGHSKQEASQQAAHEAMDALLRNVGHDLGMHDEIADPNASSDDTTVSEPERDADACPADSGPLGIVPVLATPSVTLDSAISDVLSQALDPASGNSD